ncbi:MAG TPA: LysM peptidoglycan-binding domain-containing protein [Anaerolineales bacterium]|nr:LysM peptidoglycan-binding domain-containing protein [Anaerolineales bacterium]
MDNKSSMGNVISSYRKKRQQSTIMFVYGAAGLLVLAGIALLVIWLMGPSKPLNAIFATDTPTPTLTFTPTKTPVATDTPTITATASLTPTGTPGSPFLYTVQQGDSLQAISDTHNLGAEGIPLILMLNPPRPDGTGIDPATQIIYPGEQIYLPNPDLRLPTATPIPANLPKGTKINYIVASGDSLAAIAAKFNSTVEDIVKENKLTDANSIFVGQTLVIPANLVTPTATRPPTSTPRTPEPGFTPTAPPSPTP